MKPNDKVTIEMTAAQAAVVAMVIGATSSDRRRRDLKENEEITEELRELALHGVDLFTVYCRLNAMFEEAGFGNEYGEVTL